MKFKKFSLDESLFDDNLMNISPVDFSNNDGYDDFMGEKRTGLPKGY